ncbi:MAG: WYL domain-containing protein, partial [Acidimicrobiia bacterium]
ATGMRSAKRKAPDPVELVRRGISVDAWSHRALIRLHVPMDRAEMMIPPTAGVLENIGDEECRLEIGADDLGWLAHYLLGFPFEFTIEEPVELTETLAKIGRRLVAASPP